jgi:hypothetical protein
MSATGNHGRGARKDNVGVQSNGHQDVRCDGGWELALNELAGCCGRYIRVTKSVLYPRCQATNHLILDEWSHSIHGNVAVENPDVVRPEPSERIRSSLRPS